MWLYKLSQLHKSIQLPDLPTDPHQCLVEAGRRPVVRRGVEGRVFTRHHWIGHDHAVPLVYAKAAASFDLRCQVGARGVWEQASHSLVIFKVTPRSMVHRTTTTADTGFSAQVNEE